MSDSRFHGVFSSLLKDKVGITGDQSSGSFGDDASASLGTGDQSLAEAPELKTGQIAVDVYEDGSYLVIKAPIAGVKFSDLDIDIEGNVITIRGKREQCDEVHEGNYIAQECYWGEFSRSVTLPHAINAAKVKATFSKDNVIKIFVPKDERKVKIIKVNEGG